MWAKLLKRDYFVPAAALAVAAVALLVGALFFVAHDADKRAVEHEEAIVANGLNMRLLEVAESAAQQLQTPLNDKGAPQHSRRLTMLIDLNDEPIIAYVEDEPVQSASAAPFISASRRLVRSVRQVADTTVAPLKASAPIQSSAITAVGADVFVLTATLTASSASAPVLITADKMDDAFVAVLADRFLLDDLRIQRGSGVPPPNRARISINDARGRAIAILSWLPRTPGGVLLRNALPPVLVLIAVLGVIGYLLYRRAREASRRLKASEARATHLDYHDALTGLPNRLMFGERLNRAIDEARRRRETFAVHCIDLDRFKEVNDTFGHHIGDELIRLAARKISDACRSVDTVARLGGDEFAIVQADTDAVGASNLADRIVAALAAPMELSVGRVHIGASVGIALVSEGSDAQDCMRQADLALYRVKERGRGAFCFFEEEMDAHVRYRRSLQADLHEAIVNNELALHYQPQVDGSGTVVGVEALLRWTHPTRGPLAPGIFIPVAEECGLIEALGYFTLQRAFEDSRRWPHLRVAINISATQLRIRGFTERLAVLVDEAGVSPSRFELEITETVLLGDDPQTRATLQQIRELGFSLVLDDFGTGYSSLSYLQRYPIDKIKIDRSFVVNLGLDIEGEAVVAAIVGLARALHLAVVAEGVETNEQRLRLARAGCNEVQGYLYGRPAPAAAIDALLAPRERKDDAALTTAG